jgi:hypothetical protein
MMKRPVQVFLVTLLLLCGLVFLPASAAAIYIPIAYMDEKPSTAAADGDGKIFITGITNAPGFHPDGTPKDSENSTPLGLFLIKIDPVTQNASYPIWYPPTRFVKEQGIIIDQNGSPHLLVQTSSPDYPFSWNLAGHGSNRASYITRFSPDGNHVAESFSILSTSDFTYNTGRNLGRGPDGSLYTTVQSQHSADIPITRDFSSSGRGGDEILVMKISSDGKRILYTDRIRSRWSTLLPPVIDAGPDGSVYIIGFTFQGLPDIWDYRHVMNDNADGFIAKISPDGDRMEYFMYLNGSDFHRPVSIRAGPDGSAYIAGYSYSDDRHIDDPSSTNHTGFINEGFAMKIVPDGQQVEWSTNLGEIGFDGTISIIPAPDGGAWVAGGAEPNMTASSKNHIGATGNGDAFLVKISPEGRIPAPPVIFGGTGLDKAVGVVLDKEGNPFVYGTTTSADFPLKNANQGRVVPGSAMFAASFNASDNTMRYATFIGGPTAYSPVGSSPLIDYITGIAQQILGIISSVFP